MNKSENNLNEEVDFLNVELSKTLEEKFCLEIAFNKYKEHSHVLISEKDGNISKLNSKAIEMEKGNSELKAQLAILIDANTLNVELSKNNEKIAHLHEELNQNIKILSEKNEKISNLNGKVEDLEKGNSELKAQLSKLIDAGTLNVELSKINEEMALHHEELNNKNIKILSEKNEKISNLNGKVEDLEKNIKEYKIQLTKQNEEKSLHEKDFKNHKDYIAKSLSEKVLTISHLRLKVENLEEELVGLKVQLSQKCGEKILVEQNFKEYKDCSKKVISDKDQTIKNLSIEKDNLDNRTKELEQDIKRNEKQINEEIDEKDQKIINLDIKAKNVQLNLEELKA